MTPREKFDASYTVDPSGCWLWTAGRNAYGYGRMRADGRMVGAHRFAYAAFRGPIPEGLQIDHLCRVRHCVNPEHLEPVTPGENVRRGVSFAAANARKTHCKRGHEFTEENTLLPKNGQRLCRTCQTAAVAAWQRTNRPAKGHPRGEARAGAKLTETVVREIRASTDSQAVIARRLGVSQRAVWAVLAGRTWRHVS